MAKTPTGADAYVNFGFEATEGTVSAAIDEFFGYDTTITINSDNQYQRVGNVSDQDTQKLVAKAYTGTLDIAGTLTTPYWLKSVLGSVADSGAGPYDHTYTPINITPTMSVEVGYDLDTDSVRTFLGCRVGSFTLSSAPNDTVKFSLSLIYLNETEGTSLGTQNAITDDPFCYSEATYELPAASVLADVESFDFSINRNPELVPQQGSRFYAKSVNKSREYQTSLVIPYEDATTILERFYGTATGPSTGTPAETTAQIVITNGAASTAERTLEVNLTGLGINTDVHTITPNEIIKETPTIFAREVTNIVWTDNTPTAP